MKIRATYARKVGLPGYSSVSACCEVENETRSTDPERIAEAIRHAYAVATVAVDAQLTEQLRALQGPGPDATPAAGATPPPEPPGRPNGRTYRELPDRAHSEEPAENNWRRRGASKPRDGRQLYAWAKKQEEDHGVDLIAVLGRWAKRARVDGRIVQWDGDTTAEALAWLDAQPVEQGVPF